MKALTLSPKLDDLFTLALAHSLVDSTISYHVIATVYECLYTRHTAFDNTIKTDLGGFRW